ncbi:MAG: hypothetical protein ACI31F_07095 [Muribaculaceae bacterium]
MKQALRLRESGRGIMDFDLIIACTAVSENLIMVTNNVSHFSRVENIIIENWVK